MATLKTHENTASNILASTIRADFPFFSHQPQWHYLDSAATTQPLQVVLDAQQKFLAQGYGPVHRSVYDIGRRATEQYEEVRAQIATFIGATPSEIIFTSNATAALNLVAAMEAAHLQAGDEIILSVAEHHSNLLPWQRLAQQHACKLVWIELTPVGALDLDDYRAKLSRRTKLVAISHVSNVLGYVAPLKPIITAAHAVGARVIIDAAQSAGHLPLNVHALAADYLALSGHKMYGPTGVGVLYARQELLATAPPWQVGGGMVKHVTRATALWQEGPTRFEAGTPPVMQVVGLGAALKYLQAIGMEKIRQHEVAITTYALEKLHTLRGLTLFGPAAPHDRLGIFSFQLNIGHLPLHSHDVATIANSRQVAVRAGHHCAQPLLEALGVSDLTRASAGLYTTKKDIDALIAALQAVYEVFAPGYKKQATRATP